MSARDTGGPAFPQPLVNHPGGGFTNPSDGYGLGGATLRDYFAAKAMAAILGNPACDPIDPAIRAAGAYRIADAMLQERAK